MLARGISKMRLAGRKLIATLAVVAASFAIVSIGFSAWYFAEEETSAAANGNVVVTQSAKYGHFNYGDADYPSLIVLEEGDDYLKNGVVFYKTSSSYVYIEDDSITCTYTSNGVEDQSYLDGVTLGILVSLSDDMKNYMQLIDDATKSVDSSLGDGFIPFDYDSLEFDSSHTTQSLTLHLNSYFRYKTSDVNPTDSSKYSALNSYLSAGADPAITITFTMM